MNTNGVSIVICCYNSEKLIEPTLIAAFEQNTEVDYEVILVNNNSTDKTVEIATKVFNRYKENLNFEIIDEKKAGLVYARIAGYKASKYSLISYVDDDNIISNNWVSKLYKVFQKDKKIGLVGGRNSAITNSKSKLPPWFETFENKYACGTQAEESGYITKSRKYLFGAGISFRKEVLEKIYESSLPLFLKGRKGKVLLAGDDSELCLRAILDGWELWYEESLELNHFIPKERLTWKYLLKNQQGHSAAFNILSIYFELIDPKHLTNPPSSFKNILLDWKTFLFNNIKNKKIINIYKEGTWQSLTLAHLLGLTKFYIKGYRYISEAKQQIKEYYAK